MSLMTDLRVDQGFQHDADTLGMVGNGQLLIVFLAIPFMGELAHFQTDAFQQTLGHHLGVVGHVDQLVLDGRTSTVQN